MRADSLGALPGETSAMRVEEKSAEAIVAKKRGKPRGAKGRRTTKQATPKPLEENEKHSETDGRGHGGSLPGRWWSRTPVDSGAK